MVSGPRSTPAEPPTSTGTSVRSSCGAGTTFGVIWTPNPSTVGAVPPGDTIGTYTTAAPPAVDGLTKPNVPAESRVAVPCVAPSGESAAICGEPAATLT